MDQTWKELRKAMFRLLGMLLGGGAIPREAARARSNNGCWPMLLIPLIAILIFGVLLACGIFELRIKF
jgi:hypothetical protein